MTVSKVWPVHGNSHSLSMWTWTFPKALAGIGAVLTTCEKERSLIAGPDDCRPAGLAGVGIPTPPWAAAWTARRHYQQTANPGNGRYRSDRTSDFDRMLATHVPPCANAMPIERRTQAFIHRLQSAELARCPRRAQADADLRKSGRAAGASPGASSIVGPTMS